MSQKKFQLFDLVTKNLALGMKLSIFIRFL